MDEFALSKLFEFAHSGELSGHNALGRHSYVGELPSMADSSIDYKFVVEPFPVVFLWGHGG